MVVKIILIITLLFPGALYGQKDSVYYQSELTVSDCSGQIREAVYAHRSNVCSCS